MNQQFTHFVGIDVSKKWLDFASLPLGEDSPNCFRVANTQAGIGRALKRLTKSQKDSHNEILFCVEYTGVYCYPFLEYASAKDLKVSMESAWKIKRTHSPRGKNDKLDAARICIYAKRYCDTLRLWAPESEDIQLLKELMGIRQRLHSTVKALQAPIKELTDLKATKLARIHQRFSKTPINALKKQIEQVELQISEIIDQNAELAQNVELITSIPGVGRQTAIWTILFTENFTKFEGPKQLACFCGVAPFDYSSGTSYKGKSRTSNYANKQLKTILHMAAIASIRGNPDLRAYFKRKVAEGKNKMSIVNALRNKIIHTIFAVVKRKSRWTPKPNIISN